MPQERVESENASETGDHDRWLLRGHGSKRQDDCKAGHRASGIGSSDKPDGAGQRPYLSLQPDQRLRNQVQGMGDQAGCRDQQDLPPRIVRR